MDMCTDMDIEMEIEIVTILVLFLWRVLIDVIGKLGTLVKLLRVIPEHPLQKEGHFTGPHTPTTKKETQHWLL